jgi:protein ImuB
MLYLCVSLPQLPLESRQPPSEDPVAVSDRHRSRRWLIACNEACRAAGIHPGMDATTALALYPALKLIERSASHEREALKSLAAWAEQFSHWTCFDTERLQLWIEIKSSLRYFGGVDEIRSRVEHGLAQLGHVGFVGIAPTLEAAALLSRVDEGPVVLKENDLVRSLEPLSIEALEICDETAEILGSLGLRTVGEVLTLPRASAGRRFGPELANYLDRLIGQQPDPRKPYRAPAQYRRRFELLGSIETTEGLLFPLRRMFVELEGYLIARDAAVPEVQIELCHDDVEPTRLEVRTTRPMRDAVRLFALVRERLERTALEHPVEEIVLRAERTEPLGDTQLELIDGGQRKTQGWDELVDRMRARLGDSAVRQLGLQDQHLPEQAWCTVAGADAVAAPLPERPLWLLDPRPIRVLPKRLGKPERIEGGWWADEDQRRDYHTVTAEDGSQLWLYRDADKEDWYLHGLWG